MELSENLKAYVKQTEQAVTADEIPSFQLMTDRIRRARLRRKLARGAVIFATAAAVLGGGTALVGNERANTGTVKVADGAHISGQSNSCIAKVPNPDTDSPDLALDVAVPENVKTGAAYRLTATLTNIGNKSIVGLSEISPELLIASGGLVMSGPLPTSDAGRIISLAPGESQIYTLKMVTRRCPASATDANIDSAKNTPLAAGIYQVYSELTFQAAGSKEIQSIHGGPWVTNISD